MKNTSLQKPLEIEVLNSIKQTYLIRFAFTETALEEGSIWEFEEIQFDYKPTLSEIKGFVNNFFNMQCDKEIASDFVYEDMHVWLSTENQFNYKAAWDLAFQTNGGNLPLKFKFGSNEEPIYKTFVKIEDLQNFYIQSITYIDQVLNKYWEIKNGIDWSKYEIE